MLVANAVSELDVYLEQPCATYAECVSVRSHTHLPFILDENITDLDSVLRLHKDKAADVINLKISKVGGLTKAKQVREGANILWTTSDVPINTGCTDTKD